MTLVSAESPRVAPRLLERVAARAAGIAPADGVGAEVVEHRAGRQRTVLEYRFDGGLRVFAKRYPTCEDAVLAHEALCLLGEEGFGPGSAHRVPEPLACFAEWGVLVTRAAPGRCITTLAAHPERWDGGLRAAAGWLARLHSLPAGAGVISDDRVRALSFLAVRATEAAATHPSVGDLLLRLVEELGGRAAGLGAAPSSSQTHGRFHAEHVFVAPETVTVVDLDRASPGDPAKDLGEFLHRVRAQAWRARQSEVAVQRATLAFLAEYVAHARVLPDAVVYYWSYSILFTLLRLLERGHAKWEQRLEFYRAEFDDVPRRADTLVRLAAAQALR